MVKKLPVFVLAVFICFTAYKIQVMAANPHKPVRPTNTPTPTKIPQTNTSTSSSSDLQTVGPYCTQGNTNRCGSTGYGTSNPTNLNYGDYDCQVKYDGVLHRGVVRDQLFSDLKNYVDPSGANVDKTKDYCVWRCIISRESSYNPNMYYAASTTSGGAWGLMSENPYACYPPDKHFYYRRTGNVKWDDQIKRALDLEYKALEPKGLAWRYWSTYKNTCYKEPQWTQGTGCAY